MKQGLTNKESRVLSITLACCGLLMIASGLTMTLSGDKVVVKHT